MANQPAVPVVYTNPAVLLCARCGKPVASTTRPPDAVGGAYSTQVWCDNEKCPCYNMVGDIPVTALPGSKHRSRPARKESGDAA